MTPKWLTLAHKEMGVEEVAGSKSNPRVMQYFACAPHAEWVKDDSTPWCGAFCTFLMTSNGLALPSEPLRARSWLGWGTPINEPKPGCVVVLKRGSDPASGHVALFVQFGDDGKSVYLLGGNQGDRVCIAKYRTADVLGYRWPADAPQLEVTASALSKISRKAKEAGTLVKTGAATVAFAAAEKSGAIPTPPKEVLQQATEWQAFLHGGREFLTFATSNWMLVVGVVVAIAGYRIIKWQKEDVSTGKTWSA